MVALKRNAMGGVLALLLLGLGLDEFSMSGPAIPIVKQIITQLTLPEAEAKPSMDSLTLGLASNTVHYLRRISATNSGKISFP